MRTTGTGKKKVPPRCWFRWRFLFDQECEVNKDVRHNQRSETKKKETESGRPDNSYYDRERRVRRWFGEVIITCYQMTVRVEAKGFG